MIGHDVKLNVPAEVDVEGFTSRLQTMQVGEYWRKLSVRLGKWTLLL